MDLLQEQLARMGLQVIGRRGFVLGGGHAIELHGMGDRPTCSHCRPPHRLDVQCGDFRARVDVEIFSRQAMWGFPQADIRVVHGR
jgi:hypothetical protein